MNNQPTAYQQIIAKAWSDPEYKERLLRSPKAVLQEAGMQIPDNLKVQVLADTEETVHMVLPASPAGEALSVDELEQVAGGTAFFTDTLALLECAYSAAVNCQTAYGVDCT